MGNSPKDPSDHDPGAVAEAREKAGLTKTAAASRLRVSLSLISMIESGTRNASPELIDAMATLYGRPADELKRKDGQPPTRLAKVCTGCSELWERGHQCPTERAA
jgi:transcriptional regulator with XRE-family HTH domain